MTYSLTRLLRIIIVVLLLYDVIQSNENASSFSRMISYNNRLTKLTCSDLVSECTTAIFSIPIHFERFFLFRSYSYSFFQTTRWQKKKVIITATVTRPKSSYFFFLFILPPLIWRYLYIPLHVTCWKKEKVVIIIEVTRIKSSYFIFFFPIYFIPIIMEIPVYVFASNMLRERKHGYYCYSDKD